MEETIYDINPPGKESPEPQKSENRFSFKKEPPKRRKFFPALVFLFLCAAAIFFLVKPKAEITIWPELQTKDFDIEISLDRAAQSIDFENSTIPGKAMETESIVSESFEATGQTGKKSEGTIVLYNEYTTASETWREGTRFISSEGKLFYSKSAISVPGAEYVQGELVAASVQVPVIAAEPGEEYNIGPTKFSVYVYRGTAKYPYYWAESSEKMQGGGLVLEVTEKDLQEAEESLAEKAIAKSRQDLAAKASDGWILAEELVYSEMTKVVPLAEAGQIQDSFTLQIYAKSSGIAFKKEDLQEIVERHILKNIDSGREISPYGMEIEYSLSDKDSLSFTVSVSAEIYQGIEESMIKKHAFGKNPSDAEKAILGGFFGAEKVEVSLKPFWARTIPEEMESVEVKIILE